MLSRLSIQNYAIIDNLEVDFSSRLNIITGETGAGKSIIVGALGLILGQRAESTILWNKERKCVVEGCFKGEQSDEHVEAFLKSNELDVHDDLTVRREISPNGKSRAFINDTPVNLTQLNQLSNLLVDLHQQFDTLELGESNFQREVLDALGGNFNSLKKYSKLYNSLQHSKKEWNDFKERKGQFEKEFDYNLFQFNELGEAGFRQNELEDMEQELKMMTNAEGIKNILNKISFELNEGEEPIARQLKSMGSQLQQYADIHPRIPELVQRIQSSFIELQDIADESMRLNDHISSDAASIDKINDRLSTGYRLLKKHGVKTTNELIEIREQLNNKLQAVLNIDEAIKEAEQAYSKLLEQVEELALLISTGRKEAIKPLEKHVNKMLTQIGMPNARLKADLIKTDLNSFGCDEVVFLFDDNKSNLFQPIHKVASGGELSRLMLCIKSLVARSMDLPTLIFDEIDTGISGEAARQVGSIMKELSTARQVICITHQPQIAGKADAHFLVYKEVKNQSITTGVRILDTDERIVTIAKMLSGEKPTSAALENAREMMN